MTRSLLPRFDLGNRPVGDGAPCFITFEAGPTHDGLDTALKLVTLAAEAGADAIKFQVLDPDRLVADKTMAFSYDVLVDRATGATETVTEPLYDILCRRVMTHDEWRRVKAHADGLGLAFFATALFDDEIDLLAELGCHSVKIASGDVNHWPLIRRAARTGMSLQLDTGNASLGEIESAVDVALEDGCDRIIIHQCPSGYPARLESINLRIIPTLARLFACPVAYSDHTPGWEMDVAAVALGANMVEKTITLDRQTRSCEHMFSLEPTDMAAFVRVIREVETALGAPRRILHAEERRRRRNVRRSAWLVDGGRRGDRLGDLAVDFRRPGDGVGPDLFEQLADARLAVDVPAGHRLSVGDLG
ncbi:MAG: N-acetylneuraminate synthase family protein [Rhodospirillaceae bacterium]|nr:N-acetylneuraminate synthase family protein [Rhodospirillaceae bacterium]